MNQIQQVSLGRFFAGDSKAWTIQFLDKNNQALDLSGRRIVFTAKQDIDDLDNDNILRKVYNISDETPTYDFVLSLSTNDTINIFGVYEFDLRVSFQGIPTEIQFTALRGKLTIDKSITQNME